MLKFIFRLIVLLFVSTNFLNGQIKLDHPVDCYENEVNAFKALEDVFADAFTETASIEQEIEWGDSSYAAIQREYEFSYDASLKADMKKILNKLTSQIDKFENPTDHSNYGDYNYSIYILDTSLINAFTCGQRIYITTGIIEFCESDDEIAMVIAHEIAHNELGHINDKIAKLNAANEMFGEVGGTLTYMLGSFFRTPFGQLEEGHCDLFGIDIAKKAGYEPCAAGILWERMSEKRSEKNFVDLFMSHPYSGDRASCAKSYVSNTYGRECD